MKEVSRRESTNKRGSTRDEGRDEGDLYPYGAGRISRALFWVKFGLRGGSQEAQ